MKNTGVKILLSTVLMAGTFGCTASNNGSTSATASATTNNSTTRTTTFGDVNGIANDGSMVWYGIPYAANPTGDLRWSAPQDPEKWTDTLDCTQPHTVAMQFATDADTGKTISKGTDDCLNLDVYSTENADNLPVLVYIHGGNNQSGNSQEIEGNEIVKRDNCIYVSLSYRLGLLGFNCLPALLDNTNNTGNFTMLDIAKALDWIKSNISTFGGDPNNITVSGFSAGGRDVMAMLISPIFKGKFDKAIAFSGGMTTSDVDMSVSQIATLIAPLAVEDGKASDENTAKTWLMEDTTEVKDYLYSIESSRLASAVGNANIRMSAFPHLYEDDVVIPSEGFDTTTYNNVPLLMLTGSSEFSFFNASSPVFSSDEWKAMDTETQAAGVEFGNLYGSDMYRIFNTQMSAEKMYSNYQSDIYLCQVDYGSINSASKIDTYGAFHGIFVPMLADTNGYTGIYDFTQAGYQDMATKFNSYLANFLKTGNPNGDDLTEWKKWNLSEKLTQVFDADATSATITSKNVYKTYDQIMSEMDADTTVDETVKKLVISGSMNGRWFSDAVDAKYNNESLWK